jgi:predicted Zn-dependent protease
MIPLLQATNHPERLNQASVKIVADPNINAGSAGGGEFLITTGLLQKANDEQLRGILAHEIAHDDLGHPVKMQLVGTGLSLGAALLQKVFPASGAITPIAGTLIASSYSRPQELAADRPWRDDSTTRWIFEARNDSRAHLDHANSRKQRRWILVDPPSD